METKWNLHTVTFLARTPSCSFLSGLKLFLNMIHLSFLAPWTFSIFSLCSEENVQLTAWSPKPAIYENQNDSILTVRRWHRVIIIIFIFTLIFFLKKCTACCEDTMYFSPSWKPHIAQIQLRLFWKENINECCKCLGTQSFPWFMCNDVVTLCKNYTLVTTIPVWWQVFNIINFVLGDRLKMSSSGPGQHIHQCHTKPHAAVNYQLCIHCGKLTLSLDELFVMSHKCGLRLLLYMQTPLCTVL